VFGGVEIETHDLQGQPFFVEGVGLCKFGFAYHGAEIAFLPFFIVALLPELFGFFQRFL
jgi:hypothetical protein